MFVKLTRFQARAAQLYSTISHLLMDINSPIQPVINGVELRMRLTNCE